MSSSTNLALFGGTFDPIHCGHLMIAEAAVAQMNLDQVRFLPCQISPHKIDRAPTPAQHRMSMIELAIKDLAWAEVDDFDLKSSGPSYSYLTVAEMRKRQPDARIFWLMGYDQWRALPKWREPEKLAAEVEFIVFSRGEDPVPREGWTLHPLKGQHPASSTAIRESLRDGQAPSGWLPPAVLAYITKNGLYTA